MQSLEIQIRSTNHSDPPSCAMATRIQVYLVYTRESRVWKNKMSYDKVTRYAVITEESLNLYQHNVRIG